MTGVGWSNVAKHLACESNSGGLRAYPLGKNLRYKHSKLRFWNILNKADQDM